MYGFHPSHNRGFCPPFRHNNNNNKRLNGPRPLTKNSSTTSSMPNSFLSACVQCQLCQKFGHTALESWHRFDANLSSHINANSSQFYSSDNESGEPSLLGTPSTLCDPLWYPDNGATHRIIFLQNYVFNQTNIDFNMLCSSMVHKIGSKSNCT